MKIDVSKDQVFERRTDNRGRFSLPASDYKNKQIEIVVTEVESSE